MSLTLLQGYSSAEEDEEREEADDDEEAQPSQEEDDDRVASSPPSDEDTSGVGSRKKKKKPTDLPNPPSNFLLPSALDVFAEISGPPEFLNNSVEAAGELPDSQREFGRRGRHRGGKREKKDLPAGVVVESKAHLVGIRDRVRSDVEAGTTATPVVGKRVVSATNPEPEDAAELLRMCLQCGIPKTYSHSRGMVCPVCGDRPPADPNAIPEKKKGSMIKDKEKSKRMKGQSSHSTWKSETEMHLRQQFD